MVLLLTCFSGMTVSAAQEPTSQGVKMYSKTLFPENNVPATFAAAPYEDQLTDEFMDYLKLHCGNCEEEFSISQFNIPANRASQLREIIWYETPELFHVYAIGVGGDGTKLTTMYITYLDYADTAAEYKACMDLVEKNAQVLLRGVQNSSLSDVEKALILHDRLAAFAEYDRVNMSIAPTGHKIYNLYGILGEGLAVCQGYAMGYMYLLDQVGIESDLCSSKDLYHAWNIVYIDGVAYHTDVTWDDPINPYSYEFNDEYGRVYHRNFLRSTDGIRQTNHDAYDFTDTPNNTKYDSAWWQTSVSSMELIGNDIYYFDYLNGGVYRFSNNTHSKIYDSNYYYGKLSNIGTKLLLSQQTAIYLLDPESGTVTQVYAPSDCANGGQIIGMKYQDGQIFCHTKRSGVEYRETFAYTDSYVFQITKQPANAAAMEGATAKTTVKAEGEGLQYAWYFKNKTATKYSKSSITTNTYSMTMDSTRDGRSVYCIVTDKYGNSVRSNVATLSMKKTATITKQPASVSVASGATAKTTVTATGDGLSYTWYYKDTSASTYSKSSTTTNTYSAEMNSWRNGRKVYCVVTDKYGNSVKSSVVTLSMKNVAKITKQPVNITAANGAAAKTSLTATGDGISYTWYFKNKNASTYSKSSITTNTYSMTMDSTRDGRSVYCVITDKYGNTVKSNVVTLSMKKTAKITKQPTNVVTPKGQQIKTSVTATGDGLNYTWYFKNKGASTYSKSSITTNTYSMTMDTSRNGRQVYCVVKDKYGNSVKSSVVTLTMGNPAKITKQPTSVTVASGATAKTTVTATGDGLSYTWYFKNKGASGYTKSSVTTSSYAMSMDSTRNGRSVYCVVTDKYGNSVKSNVVTLNRK